MLTKQEILLGKSTRGEQQAKETQNSSCHMACSLRFHGDGINFRFSLTNHSYSRVLPGGGHLV